MTRPQFPRRTHRARERLTTWTRAHPWREGYWRAVEAVRAARHRAWPPYVFLPLEEAGAIVARAWHAHGRQPTPGTIVAEACALQGLAAWRVSQGIYRFDQALAAALVETPLTGDLPVEALTRLPEWCVYIETPGRTTPTTHGPAPLHGVWAWLDWVAPEARAQLHLGLDLDTATIPVSVVPLVGTLEEAIRATAAQWQDNYEVGRATSAPGPDYADAARATLPGLIALVLYLCAEDADFGGRARPQRPRATRTKHGWRLFPASAPRTWDVGVRLGAALRHAAATRSADEPLTTGTRARPRPHIRRAHWHAFWRGPRDQQQQLVWRWLPPIPVNLALGDELPATIRRVEGEE